MILRKQTVWLLTMLAVMVVLSGYYLVKGPQEQVPTSGKEQAVQKQEQISGVVVESKQVGHAPQATPVDQAPKATPVDEKNGTQEAKTPAAPEAKPAATNTVVPVAETASEIFQGYKMKREAMLQQQKDEQLAIVNSTESSPQAVAEAMAKFEELSNMESATMTAEEMLKASGYQDAVVTVQNDKATVLVQKDKLSANEVVEIIANVKQHLNIPATNINVQYKSS
ncbi:SpoIIIAH-like family protein [Brevibacillus porteri]|uniref:Stage III sporulation protein AH n=1 Tax=Brevibacillus porteri TaxID=2126350 RepID=A0ABX5FMN3_9BACL|nr:SpoIIIAH-like family protein [Brevibacillus porteri]MED1801686.1 SpoIIIAH-like family protein [Brevibacillus porteri]MED2133399.1 SpoIIIAH-like family protein [Brevibacillus porteri]MED2745848.1 SpoIIIAH-like family protein [Brevibacillus porteri]MED2818180.1 SpoIIIAH-like family protein [Brevibacillus porteri]MED2893564.1 SpoIIIAH-like family protein [Brevibacillus porteri]